METSRPSHQCIVCGCRKPYGDASTVCDHVCRRAKQAGLTRGQQIYYDMNGEKFYGRRLPPRPSRTEVYYNQPYMRHGYT